jgi:hypothetical protein
MERNRVRIGDVGMRHNVAEQLTNMEAELNPITRAKSSMARCHFNFMRATKSCPDAATENENSS